ncbi:MAG TPA: phage tail assembly chaperone [Sphingobium sp.]|nr:phage tail assembly chaperone [Sphingobium sp.]
MTTFADCARRLAGQAGLLLGWRPEEYWAATPEELATGLAPLHDGPGADVPAMDRALIARLKEIHPDG